MMLRKLFLAAFCLLGLAGEVLAADRYWVGGTASWDAAAGAKWALTSGGAGGQAVPTNADDVFFDAASGAVTVTLGAASAAKSVNFTGFTGTFAGASAMVVSGSVTLAASMTFTNTSTWTFDGTGSLTQAGKTMNGVTVNGVGITVTPVGAVSLSGALGVSNGHWNAATNDPTHTIGTFNSSSSNVRSVSMGDGLWTITGTGTIWTTVTTTNLTFNKDAADIKITNTTVGTSKTFSGGGLTFNDLWLANSGLITLGSGSTFDNLRADGTNQTVSFTTAGTWTVSSLSILGTYPGTTAILMQSSTADAPATINDSSGTNAITGAAIRGITFGGGATYTAGGTSYDLGNNSGITFESLGGGAHGYGLGGPYFTSN